MRTDSHLSLAPPAAGGADRLDPALLKLAGILLAAEF